MSCLFKSEGDRNLYVTPVPHERIFVSLVVYLDDSVAMLSTFSVIIIHSTFLKYRFIISLITINSFPFPKYQLVYIAILTTFPVNCLIIYLLTKLPGK